MQNKKSIMTFSALQILIFHLWIYILNNNEIEIFLKQTSYIGVDIFFLISAYSLASRNVDHYGKFLLFRFKAVYLKFIIFAVVATIYSHWSLIRLLSVISGVEIFKKGGGAFLWFIPAIMLFYIIFPLFQQCENKYKTLTPLATIIIWIVIELIITTNKELNHLAIVWNRIPIFIFGYYISKLNSKTNIFDNKTFKTITGIMLLIIGTVLIYNFAYKIKLQTPFKDTFYFVVIISSIGLVMLLSNIPEIRLTRWIGSSTLEIYAIQMIFGYNIANKLILIIKNKIVLNIVIIAIIVAISVIIHYSYEYITMYIERRRKKNVI